MPMRLSKGAAFFLAIAAGAGCDKTTSMSTGSSTAGGETTSVSLKGGTPGHPGGGGAAGTGLTPAIKAFKVSEEATRRGIEPDYLNSQKYGAPRGREFQDIIPIGARLTAINVCGDDRIDGIWLSYELAGKTAQTPCRGNRRGREQSFTLDKREKIVGVHGYGTGSVDLLVIATNQRVATLGNRAAAPPDARPSCTLLDDRDRQRFVAVGIVGRADDRLRQFMLRIQVRSAT